MARSRKKLGDILVGWGVISAAQSEQATNVAKGSGKRLGDVLVELSFAKEEQVAKALANQFGMEYVDLHLGLRRFSGIRFFSTVSEP